MVDYVKCKYFCLDTEETLEQYTGATTAIHTGSTYGVPGYYHYNSQKYDMTREGLYRISGFDGSGNLFIYNKIIVSGVFNGDASADLYKFISALSWNHVHGTDDNNASYQTVSNAGAHRKWRSQCGFIVGLAQWMIPQLGFTARGVNVSTNEALNNFDNGHYVLETLHGTEWRMWDLTGACYFRDSTGKHMSVADFIAQISSGGTFPEKVMLSHADKTNSNTIYNVDLNLYIEMLMRNEDEKESWYRRIFQKIV